VHDHVGQPDGELVALGESALVEPVVDALDEVLGQSLLLRT